jgi:hypothetical protein
MDFPKFEGENPMVWQQECETYFELYHVSDDLRTRYASLNFRGTAALWLRNVQAKGRIEDWGEMCRLVHDKFGKNKYMQYRRQMRALRQIGTVAEYIDKFEILRNQLLLYNPALDEAFFVDEFMHGLRDDIRSAIHLHCPKDLDSASLLTMMQEEDLESSKKQSPARSEYREFAKSNFRSNYNSDKLNSREKHVPKHDEAKKPDTSEWEDRLESLKAYRRSKGLCFTCGDKYSKTHRCPDKIPLHIIEELMEILPISDAHVDVGSDADSDSDDLMLLASTTDLPSAAGSVSSFISSALAQKLGSVTKTMPA